MVSSVFVALSALSLGLFRTFLALYGIVFVLGLRFIQTTLLGHGVMIKGVTSEVGQVRNSLLSARPLVLPISRLYHPANAAELLYDDVVVGSARCADTTLGFSV